MTPAARSDVCQQVRYAQKHGESIENTTLSGISCLQPGGMLPQNTKCLKPETTKTQLRAHGFAYPNPQWAHRLGWGLGCGLHGSRRRPTTFLSPLLKRNSGRPSTVRESHLLLFVHRLTQWQRKHKQDDLIGKLEKVAETRHIECFLLVYGIVQQLGLLSKGVDTRIIERSGNTLLHASTKGENGVVCRWLLEQKADPEKFGAKGKTPVKMAIENNSPGALAALLDHGAEVDASALMHSLKNGHARLVTRLAKALPKKAINSIVDDYTVWTALEFSRWPAAGVVLPPFTFRRLGGYPSKGQGQQGNVLPLPIAPHAHCPLSLCGRVSRATELCTPPPPEMPQDDDPLDARPEPPATPTRPLNSQETPDALMSYAAPQPLKRSLEM